MASVGKMARRSRLRHGTAQNGTKRHGTCYCSVPWLACRVSWPPLDILVTARVTAWYGTRLKSRRVMARHVFSTLSTSISFLNELVSILQNRTSWSRIHDCHLLDEDSPTSFGKEWITLNKPKLSDPNAFSHSDTKIVTLLLGYHANLTETVCLALRTTSVWPLR